MSNVIPLRPKHQPIKDSHSAVLTVLQMIREGGHSKQSIELLLSAVADNLYDYVETIEGR
ncbi:hypothetical protein PZBJ_20265 [Pantoea endophytica]|uniref:Uncharacterized protein n=1 Tax=Pantoea endophytica TaxID=92488 RepID=A0ABX4SL35_9GAMM|nr:hypothetical protein [Pantoea endophytica]PLR20390.1 hypothetical protein PZBJ_20265 [Pantoea endophytica]